MRIALAASALALALGTAGLVSCTGTGGPPVAPGPEPSTTPVYASDEEALAAAEEAYQRYLDVTNAMAQSGWVNTSHLPEVADGQLLADELESAQSLAGKGYVQVGESSFDSITLQRAVLTAPLLITVYLCLDVSQVDVVNSNGDSIVSPGRPARQPLEVDLEGPVNELKVIRSDVWSGDSFC